MPTRTRAYHVNLGSSVQHHKALWPRCPSGSYYPSQPSSKTSFLLKLIYTLPPNKKPLSRPKFYHERTWPIIYGLLPTLCFNAYALAIEEDEVAQPLHESSHTVQIGQIQGCKGSAVWILLVHKADRLTTEVLPKQSTCVSRIVFYSLA